MEFGDVKLSIEAMEMLGKDVCLTILLNHLQLNKKDIITKKKTKYIDSDSDSEPEEKPKKKTKYIDSFSDSEEEKPKKKTKYVEPEEKPKKKTKYIDSFSDSEEEKPKKKELTRKSEYNDGFNTKTNYDSDRSDSDSEPEEKPKPKPKPMPDDLDIFKGFVINRKDVKKIVENRNGKKEEIKVKF